MGLPVDGEEDDDLFIDPFKAMDESEAELEDREGDKVSWTYSNYIRALEKEDLLNNTDESMFSSLTDGSKTFIFIHWEKLVYISIMAKHDKKHLVIISSDTNVSKWHRLSVTALFKCLKRELMFYEFQPQRYENVDTFVLTVCLIFQVTYH